MRILHSTFYIPYSKQSGFTLIELLVAFGLFAVMSTIAVGGFVRVLRAERQTAALLSVNSNTSLVMEQMAREIRTGTNFCDGRITSCSSSHKLSFLNAQGCAVTYNWNESNSSIEKSDGCQGSTFSALTAGNIDVHYLTFVLLGNKAGDGYPPRITVLIGVSPKESELQESIVRLQTTVSARQIDN